MIRSIVLAIMMLTCGFEAYASEISCDPFYLKKANSLKSVSLFFTKSIGERFIEELTPDLEKSKNNAIIQEWQINPRSGLKLFVACAYQDNKVVAKEIPNKIAKCRFNFFDNGALTIPHNSFYCN